MAWARARLIFERVKEYLKRGKSRTKPWHHILYDFVVVAIGFGLFLCYMISC